MRLLSIIPERRRRLVLYWVPLVAWMAAIFVLSSMSAEDIERSTPKGFPLASKTALAHVVEFAVLGTLVHRLLSSYGLKSSPRLWGAVLALTIGYALTDEFHQSFVPGRDPSWVDVGLDSLGAAIGLLVRELAVQLRRRFGDGGRPGRTPF